MTNSKIEKLETKKRKVEVTLNVAEYGLEGQKRPTKKAKSENLIKTENEKLEGEELQALRKRLRDRKKLLKSRPNFRLKAKGFQAALDVPEEDRVPLLMSDLQHLILYALLGTKAPISPDSWSLFEQWNKLTNVNLLVIDGLGLEEYQKCDTWA